MTKDFCLISNVRPERLCRDGYAQAHVLASITRNRDSRNASEEELKMWEKNCVYIAVAMAPLSLLNFFVFMGIAQYLGGTALTGKIVAEHYYVGSHGQYTEVSYGVFVYSTIHGLLTLGSFFLMIGLMLLVEFKGKKHFP